MRSAICPICAEPAAEFDRRPILRVQHKDAQLTHRLSECSGCRHVFVSPQPTAEELAPFYGDDYNVFAPDLSEIRIAALIDRAHREDRFNHARIVPGGRYLDVGCGLGENVAAMQRLGMDACGVEPSPIAVEKSRALGVRVACGFLRDAQYPSDHFDLVTMYHVLEHIPDPMEVLRECYRIMRNGAELVIGIPNIESLVLRVVGARDWTGFDPTHIHYFRWTSIEAAVRSAGFAVARIETESIPAFVEGNLAAWARRRFFIPFRLTIATHALRPLARFLSRRGMAQKRGEAFVLACLKN